MKTSLTALVAFALGFALAWATQRPTQPVRETVQTTDFVPVEREPENQDYKAVSQALAKENASLAEEVKLRAELIDVLEAKIAEMELNAAPEKLEL